MQHVLKMTVLLLLTCQSGLAEELSSLELPSPFGRIASNGYFPAWTPDGANIVYGSTGNVGYDVWVAPSQGGQARRLTHNGGYHPAVSRDGITLSYDERGRGGRIVTRPLWGGGADEVVPLTTTGNFSSWGPDALHVVFASNGDIWRVSLDGGNAKEIISLQGEDTRPCWSPDGSKIVFDSRGANEGDNFDIWLYDVAGKKTVRLTQHTGRDIQVSWSPVGKMITFMSERSGNMDIWIMTADGTGKRQITTVPGSDVWPRWSPDGGKLAFGSDRAGSMDIWVVDLDTLLANDYAAGQVNQKAGLYISAARQLVL